MKKALFLAALALVAILLAAPGASLYYESGNGQRCTSCHEMKDEYDRWHASSHRGIACEKCHGGAMTVSASFHLNNAKRALNHVEGNVPDRIPFSNDDVQAMTERCASCHRQEYAAWSAGPHSASYARIFVDKKYNSKNMLMDDCLRCHGMHFEGGVRDLVQPVNRTGPWKIVPADLERKPSMPCISCHDMHREGPQSHKTAEGVRTLGAAQEKAKPSLALWDRRSQSYIGISDLPMPAMLDKARPVRMSKDQRQALCYQCHAPISTLQVGSGDDRTGMGVHEGISCLSCHQQHGQNTRTSCATCHPKMSNCGIDVEKMDTTFASTSSRHNVHWVKCADCHTKGVPPRKKDSSL